MLTALILICAAGASDCTSETALDVLRTPVESGNPATCFLHGQAFLAQMELGRSLSPGTLVKIACRPKRG